MFCYQVAAYRRSRGHRLDRHLRQPGRHRAATLSFGLPEDAAIGAAAFLAEHVFATSGVPAWMSRTGFRLLDPGEVAAPAARPSSASSTTARRCCRSERQRRFLEADGWVAWPGPALADVIRQFGAHNRLVSGGFVIEDRLVTLADIDLPDPRVRRRRTTRSPRRARSVRRAGRRPAPTSTRSACRPAISASSSVRRAVETTWPTVAAWARWRDGDGELPDGVERIEEIPERPEHGLSTRDRVGAGAQLAVGAGIGTVQALAGGRPRRRPHGPRGRRRHGGTARPAQPARPGQPANQDLVRAAPRRAGGGGSRRRRAALRRPCAHPPRGQGAGRQRGPRAARDRRPAGRARRAS